MVTQSDAIDSANNVAQPAISVGKYKGVMFK